MAFHEQLALLRRARGISQEALAEQLGVSRQAVSKWETGASQPELGNILALCRILEVTPNELLRTDGSSAETVISQETPPKADTTPTGISRKKLLVGAAVFSLCLLMIIGLGITKWQKEREGYSPKIESCYINSTRVLNGAREFTVKIIYSSIPENQTYQVHLIDVRHAENFHKNSFDVQFQGTIGYVTFRLPFGTTCSLHHISNAKTMSYQQTILKITECTADTYDQELLVK